MTEPSRPAANPPDDEQVTLSKSAAPGTAKQDPESPAPNQSDAADAEQNVPVEWEKGDVILDTYEVKAELGKGGFGEVHKVHHKGWNVDMAVKSARVDVAEKDVVREAEVWMELGLHPNIVSCHFVRKLGGIPRIFVEYVDGGTLHDWLYGKEPDGDDGEQAVAQPPRELTLAQRLGIAIEICRGMQHAHTFEWTGRDGNKHVGIVHRDLKPANILMTDEGVPRVTDFGLVGLGVAWDCRSAKRGSSLRAQPGTHDAANVTDDSKTLVIPRAPRHVPDAQQGATLPSMVGGGRGTPQYMAPEQWDQYAVTTQAADIYAFGAILYELFCGRRPFELPARLKHAMAQLQKEEFRRMHCEEPPPDPSSLVPNLDSELSALILECLQKDPTKRIPRGFASLNTRLKGIYERVKRNHYDDLRPEPQPTDLLADSLNNRALSYFEVGQPARADQLWQTALQADPQHPESTYNRGIQLWRSARITDDQLVRQLEEARTPHERELRSHYLLALVHLERGDVDSAAELLTHVATHVSRDATVLGQAEALAACGNRIVYSQKGSQYHTMCVAASPDGTLVAAGNQEGEVTIWESISGRCLWRLRVTAKPANCLTFSPDSSFILVGSGFTSASGVVRERLQLIDARTGSRMRALDGPNQGISVCAISSDGRYLLSAGKNGLWLHNSTSGECVWQRGLTESALAVGFTSNEATLLVVRETDLMRCQPGRNEDILVPLCWQSDACNARASVAAISHDGCTVATVRMFSGHNIQLWDFTTGRCVGELTGNSESVAQLVFSPNDRLLLSGALDGTVRVWDVDSGRCTRTFRAYAAGMLGPCPGFSANGNSVFRRTHKGTIECETLNPGRPQALSLCKPLSSTALAEHAQHVSQLMVEAQAALAAGRHSTAYELVARATDVYGHERSWPLVRLRAQAGLAGRAASLNQAFRAHQIRPKTQGQPVRAVCLAPNQQFLLFSDCGDATQLHATEMKGGKYDGPSVLIDMYHGRLIRTVDISPDSRSAMYGGGLAHGGSGDPFLYIVRDLHAHRTQVELKGHEDTVNSAAFLRDGCFAVTASVDRTHGLWDVKSCRLLRRYRCQMDYPLACVPSPDGRYALSASRSSLWYWELATGHSVAEHRLGRAFDAGINDVAIAPCGTITASADDDGATRLWRLPALSELRVLRGQSPRVRCVIFLPDSRWVLAGGEDGSIDIWAVEDGTCVRTLGAHAGPVTQMTMAQESHAFISGGEDGAVGHWALAWDYEFPDKVAWDGGAEPYLRAFLRGHANCPKPQLEDQESEGEDTAGSRGARGTPTWEALHFHGLLRTLQCAGYGWLRPEGVRHKLCTMAREWAEAPSCFGQPTSASRHPISFEHRGTPETQARKIRKPEAAQYQAGRRDATLSANAVLAEARQGLDQGKRDAAEQVIAERLPKLMLGGSSFADRYAVSVCEARLDTARGIVWVTGDVGFTLATMVAYPYDLNGHHLAPHEIVDKPSAAWLHYDNGRCPVGLPLRAEINPQRPGSVHLVAAPGDNTLVYEHTNGEGHVWARYIIDYNGNQISGPQFQLNEPSTSSAGTTEPRIRRPLDSRPKEAETMIRGPREAAVDLWSLKSAARNEAQRTEGPTPAACQHCGKPMVPDTLFCVYCGKRSAHDAAEPATDCTPNRPTRFCACGSPNPPENDFCGQCGRRLRGEAKRMCVHCGETVPQRRQVLRPLWKEDRCT